MLPGFILSLREGLEAALIIGILMGSLIKNSQLELRSTVWGGVGAAAALSLLVAALLQLLGSELEGTSEVIFEGSTLLLASALLTWMIFWMSGQSRHIKVSLEAGVRRAVLQGGRTALFTLAFVSILREGIELALYLAAAVMSANSIQVTLGALLGLATAILLGYGLFSSLIRLNLGLFYRLTGLILILFAAGMVVHGVREFTEIGWIPVLTPHIYNLSSLINENSVLGQLLGALFGYSSAPSLVELITYLGYFTLIGAGLLAYRHRQARIYS